MLYGHQSALHTALHHRPIFLLIGYFILIAACVTVRDVIRWIRG